jgi:hypothetical protein
MTKQAFMVTLFLVFLPALGGASTVPSPCRSPCPTCAKSPLNTSLIDELAAQNKDKTPSFYNFLPQGDFTEKSPPTPPIGIIKTQPQRRSKDEEAPGLHKAEYKRIPPLMDPRNDTMYKLMEKRQLREQFRRKK